MYYILNYVIYSYQKQHPEAKTKEESEFEDWYESDSQRELHQIFSGQSQITDSVKVLSQKLDEVVGRQERTLSLLSNVQSTMTIMSSMGGVQGQPHGKKLCLSFNLYFTVY